LYVCTTDKQVGQTLKGEYSHQYHLSLFRYACIHIYISPSLHWRKEGCRKIWPCLTHHTHIWNHLDVRATEIEVGQTLDPLIIELSK
jgi:hypothetical protein